MSACLCGLLGDDRLRIIDVGAAGGLAGRWKPVAPVLDIVAFEPDARSDAHRDARHGARVTIVAGAAAACEGRAELFLTRKPRCSSLLEPNRAVIDRYPEPDRFDVLQRTSVECTTVDSALARLGRGMDFLKIDTQGTELAVLRGAERSLAACLGIEVEVEFQQLYAGAGVFRDVDAYVSQQGFDLFDLRRTFFTRDVGQMPVRQRKGQLVFGDALYFRDWKRVVERSRIIKLAVLMLVYGFADAVLEIATGSTGVSTEDRQALRALCHELRPIEGVDVDRKDRFVGAGLQLG